MIEREPKPLFETLLYPYPMGEYPAGVVLPDKDKPPQISEMTPEEVFDDEVKELLHDVGFRQIKPDLAFHRLKAKIMARDSRRDRHNQYEVEKKGDLFGFETD